MLFYVDFFLDCYVVFSWFTVFPIFPFGRYFLIHRIRGIFSPRHYIAIFPGDIPKSPECPPAAWSLKDFFTAGKLQPDVASFTFASGLWILVTIPIPFTVAIQVMQGGKRHMGSVADTSSPTTSDSYIQRQGVSQTFRLGMLLLAYLSHIKIIYILVL